ncbi:hypothetical protein NESM_000014300 [Novymonas esmeraldas]|uniref:Uncharacterized protein n=1 Tax=Novymonas esmeraldas TaxID=1808958 RepID=A0AAW0F1J5_9TRYP
MSHEPSATKPAGVAAHETPRPTSHNGSTSSSNTTTPRESAIRPGPTLWIEMWENQRWFPVIGWGTSRILGDLPTFCTVPPESRLCGAHPIDFDTAFAAANPPSTHASNAQWPARCILSVALPVGYRWVGFWEVHKDHPHGSDAAGWRYGERFFTAADTGAAHTRALAPFKKTHTPLCVVRRRLWRRRVAVSAADPAAPLTDDLTHSEEEQQLRSYLSERQEEMGVAERLMAEERAASAAGEPWSTEQEMRAEEELRRFCRERRSRESATRMRSNNPSFANPFRQHDGAFQASPTADNDSDRSAEREAVQLAKRYGGAEAASPWATEGPADHHTAPATSASLEEPVANDAGAEGHGAAAPPPQHDAYSFHATSANTPSRVDGSELVGQNTVQEFVVSTPTDAETWRADGEGVLTTNTVDEFVAASPTDAADVGGDSASPTGVSVGGLGNPTGADFRAIFSQFIAPEGDESV